MIEKCNECGESVEMGSGLFVGRIIDINDLNCRKAMNKPFPEGDYTCLECDLEIRKIVRN